MARASTRRSSGRRRSTDPGGRARPRRRRRRARAEAAQPAPAGAGRGRWGARGVASGGVRCRPGAAGRARAGAGWARCGGKIDCPAPTARRPALDRGRGRPSCGVTRELPRRGRAEGRPAAPARGPARPVRAGGPRTSGTSSGRTGSWAPRRGGRPGGGRSRCPDGPPTSSTVTGSPMGAVVRSAGPSGDASPAPVPPRLFPHRCRHLFVVEPTRRAGPRLHRQRAGGRARPRYLDDTGAERSTAPTRGRPGPRGQPNGKPCGWCVACGA